MSVLSLSTSVERWPLAKPFIISRGAKTEATVVVVEVSDGTTTGRGECVPYARYGETVDGVVEAITDAGRSATRLQSRLLLRQEMPAGAARNALDLALWDFEAKRSGTSVPQLLGLRALSPLDTCYTLSLADPNAMAEEARAVPHLPILKLKLGGAGDDARMLAVRKARPEARLVADANEAWSADELEPFLKAAAAARFELIEQPLPQGADDPLERVDHLVPICADESAHTSADIAALRRRYEAVNIKLDKAGGLTEALDMSLAARRANMRIMVGSMVSTSLAVAPAFFLGQGADWVDLDGPLLLAHDREPGITIANARMSPPNCALWG